MKSIPILKVRDNAGNVRTISVVAAPSVLAPHADSHKATGADPIKPADIDAAEKNHSHTAEDVGASPVGHKHTAEDVGAAETVHTHTAEDVEGLIELITTANGAARIATGSYVGTGTCGASNPTTLTVDFDVKFLVVGYGGSNMYAIPATGYAYAHVGNGYAFPIIKSGNTLSWYHTTSQVAQMNSIGTTYHYVAIG